MIRFRYLSLVLLAHVAWAHSGRPAVRPDQVVTRFYATIAQRSDGFLGDLDRLTPFLSIRLRSLVASAKKANDDYLRLHPGDVPPFEHGSCVFLGIGDCDLSAFKVIRTRGTPTAPLVTVELQLYDRRRPELAPFRWTNTIALRLEDRRWVIVDVKTPGGTSTDQLVAIIGESDVMKK